MNAKPVCPMKTLPIFVIACLVVFAIGGLFIPGAWYDSLNRAPWTPPNIAFPIVWFFLYLFIAISGWQIFNTQNRQLKYLWVIQLLVNALWSWVFFGQYLATIGLINLLILDLLVITILVKCITQGLKMSTWLTMPYLAWLLIATSLNGYIVVYN